LRILLCQSYLGGRGGEPIVFPLGISYLASMAKTRHEVYCWDPNICQNPMKELESLIEKINPDVVGVSLRNIDSLNSFNERSYYEPFVSMTEVIRKHAPSCNLIVGGFGFSLFAKEIMKKNPEIDIGVEFEGELAFAELLRNLDHPERVRNLIFRKEGKLFSTERREWANLDSLPLPSRELFEIKKYLEIPYSIGINSNRGCGFDCIFCSIKSLNGDYCRLRSPKKVVDEIELLVNDFGLTSFVFADELFGFPAENSREICREIVKRKLDVNWQGAFSPAYFNKSFMEEALRAGCTLFDFSPDGASNNSLRFLGKNFTVREIEKTITTAKEVDGANVAYSFLYDLPERNWDQVVGLMRLVPKIMLTLKNKLRFISLTRIRIYPYSKIYEIALAKRYIDASTDLIHPLYYRSTSSSNILNYLVYPLRTTSILFQRLYTKAMFK